MNINQNIYEIEKQIKRCWLIIDQIDSSNQEEVEEQLSKVNSLIRDTLKMF